VPADKIYFPILPGDKMSYTCMYFTTVPADKISLLTAPAEMVYLHIRLFYYCTCKYDVFWYYFSPSPKILGFHRNPPTPILLHYASFGQKRGNIKRCPMVPKMWVSLQMFKCDFSDMCRKKNHLVSMWVRAEGQACIEPGAPYSKKKSS
jgi:hypothetical protein